MPSEDPARNTQTPDADRAASTGPIALLGATGRTGFALLERAVPAGLSVRAIVRDPARLARFAQHPNVQTSRAPLDDPAALADAIAGCRAVVSSIGPRGLDPKGLYTTSLTALVRAMAVARVQRLLAVTSSGHEPDPAFPLFFKAFVKPVILRRIYADMAEAEEVVRASSLDWTIVRPSMFIRHEPTRTFRVRDRLNPENGWKVSREHTAEFMLEELRRPNWIRRHPALAY